jgi:hypothetical protein
MVTGLDLEQVAGRFAAQPDSKTFATFGESFNGYPAPTYVLLGAVPGGVLALENNGWHGTEPAVLEALSRSTRAAAFYRSVNADMSLLHAVDGSVVASFDPLLDDVPAEVAPLAGGLDFDAHPEASSFALLTRLTGVRLEPDWLEDPHSRFDVPSPA